VSYTRGPLPRYWHSIDTLTHGPLAPQAASASGAWPTADLAIYVPVAVERRVIVKQLWFASQTTGTGNYDIGLYDAAGTKVLSRGSTAKGATAIEVVWDCTDTTIGPGIYYLALNCSNATDTFQRFAPAAPICAALGIYTEAVGSVTLPATATFAVNQTLAYIPILGMFLDTRVT
jgi:hypothetical protein